MTLVMHIRFLVAEVESIYIWSRGHYLFNHLTIFNYCNTKVSWKNVDFFCLFKIIMYATENLIALLYNKHSTWTSKHRDLSLAILRWYLNNHFIYTCKGCSLLCWCSDDNSVVCFNIFYDCKDLLLSFLKQLT